MWYDHPQWKFKDMWVICGACEEPISIELLTRKCQAGEMNWGRQSTPPTYGHRQATMDD